MTVSQRTKGNQMQNNPNHKTKPRGSHRWLQRGVRQQTVRLGVDVSEPKHIAESLPNLLESLMKFRRRILDRLVNHRLEHGLVFSVGRGKTTLRAGDNIVRLRVSKSLKVTVAALRALNIFDAHKVLDGDVLPNDPKLSHGANNCKRAFAAKRKMKEQPPLAPARC
jgi:hypothetical protein